MYNIDSIIRCDALCAAIFALLSYLVIFETKVKRRADQWVTVALLLALGSAVTSILARYLEGTPVTGALMQTAGICVNFASCSLMPFVALSLLVYTWMMGNEKQRTSRAWVFVPGLIAVVIEVVLAYLAATGRAYVYDEKGFLNETCQSDVFPLLCGIVLSYSIFMTLWVRKALGVRTTVVLCLNHVIVLFAVVIEASDPKYVDVGLMGMAFALALIAIYVPILQNIRAQESAAAKSMFVASVSHDIRTPLNAILGFASLLKDEAFPQAEHARALEAIETGGNLLMGLINDVLDFSKIEQGVISIVPEPSDLAVTVDDVLKVFQASNRESGFELICENKLSGRFVVDPRRIRQILFNLIGNAAKFTTKGSITVRAEYTATEGNLGALVMSVADTGIGIPEERQPDLMQPYVQVQNHGRGGGTGLGLYICRRLAEAMGGKLTLESEYGSGTTMTLTLPNIKVVEPKADESPLPGAALPPLRAGRILVVDDIELNLKVVKAMLERIGCTDVVLARDGTEALDLMRYDRTITTVLTDLWMPKMDGNALVAAIRADPRTAKIPVFVITADVEVVNDSRAFDGILLKPITIENLRKILQKDA